MIYHKFYLIITHHQHYYVWNSAIQIIKQDISFIFLQSVPHYLSGIETECILRFQIFNQPNNQQCYIFRTAVFYRVVRTIQIMFPH